MTERDDVPQTAGSITLGWLSGALDEHIEGRLNGFDVEILGEGEGFTGVIARVRLRYAPGGSGPESVIVKLPTVGDNRAAVEAVGAYEREIRVYTELAHRIPIAMPACLHADFDEQPGAQHTARILRFLDGLPGWLLRIAIVLIRWLGRFSRRDYVLVLEDMDPATPGNQVAGCGVDVARRVLVDAARMHAEFWGAGPDDERPWLLPGNVAKNMLQQAVADTRAEFRAAFERDLSSHGLAALDQYSEAGTEIEAKLFEAPLTLTHGDLRLDNIFFESDRRVRAYADWQGVGFGPAALDVAYFLSGSLDRSVTLSDVEVLLGDYHAALVEAGVEGYSIERFRADVDLAFRALIGRISLLVELDFGEDRGQDLVHAWVRRLDERLQAVDLTAR